MISPLQYLVIVNVIYFFVGMFNIFGYKFTETEYIQLVWVLILMLPVFFPIRKIVRGAPLMRFK